MTERSPDSLHYFDRFRARKSIAAACLLLSMSGCAYESETDDRRPAAPFNTPESSEYLLDTEDYYFDKLREAADESTDIDATAKIDQLLETPIAQWLNTSIEESQQIINENLELSRADGSLPVFVAYNIPNRDLGGEAGGGLRDASEYEAWTQAISETIGDSPTIIVVEPDALAGVPVIESEADQQERIDMLADALRVYQQQNENTAVYLDAGHSKWQSPTQTADLLRRVDPNGDLVGGIALNVSNQRSNEETEAYAEAVQSELGYSIKTMIDVSMNGAESTDDLIDWCNPDGERIGQLSDTTYDPSLAVEQMYIKVPGESDGRCGTSSAIAGAFDPELLLRQIS